MNELQKVELDILNVFSQVAEKEKLTWFIMFGTLLGAVRQKGFIPWDDDIDIAIPRADYNRLRLSEGWFAKPYFLQTPHNDPAAAPRFIRLRRSDTTVVTDFPNGMTCGGNMGAYIDIMPLDDVPDGIEARQIKIASGMINRQMRASAALDECAGAELPKWKEIACYRDGGIEGRYTFFADRYEKICSAHSDMTYYAITVLKGERGCRVYEKQWFSDSINMEFEGLSLPAPIGWKEVLITAYPHGTEIPKESNRSVKHTKEYKIDMNRSYEEYVRRYTDMLCGIESKKVYIFGAGDSLRIWLERYSKGLDVICAFDNSDVKWGKTAYGIPVRQPSQLPKMLDTDSRLIIASVYYEDISRQLDNMGIKDYFIFIDGLGYKR